MHTFHFPFGEMAPTLQDVSLLLSLPIVGYAAFLSEAPAGWCTDLLDRFQGVLPPSPTKEYYVLPPDQTHGPSLRWLSQFRVGQMDLAVDKQQVSRHLETHLLWLFGWVLFTTNHGNTVDTRLIGHARVIA